MTLFSIALLLVAGSSGSSRPIAQSERAGSSFDQEQKAARGSSAIVARLQLADGTIAGKATVQLESKESLMGFPMYATERQAEAETGLVRFENVPPGKYVLVARWQADAVEPPHSLLLRPSSVALPPSTAVWWGLRDDVSPTDSDLRITLTKGGKQKFVVRTSAGEEVDALFARAALRKSQGLEFSSVSACRVLTMARSVPASADGFELNGLAPGEWTCVLTISGYGRTGEVSLTVPHDDVIEVTVPKFITVTGQVRTPDGVPASDVWVGIQYEPTHLLIVEDGQTATRSDRYGRFRITSVRAGHAKLKASAEREKYLFETDLVLESGKNLTDLRIDLTLAK